MPEDRPTTSEESKPSTDEVKPKSDLKDVKSSLWKKVLYWVLGIVAAIGAFIGLIFLLKGKDNAKDAAQRHIDRAKAQIAEADLEAKIKEAEAQKEEKAVIDKLKELRKIEDEHERAKELAKLL